jgi:hypothetical protein
MTTKETKGIHERFFDARQKFDAVRKESKAYSYNYANLETVLEAVEPHLTKEGLYIQQNVDVLEGSLINEGQQEIKKVLHPFKHETMRVVVRTFIFSKEGECIEFGQTPVVFNKNDPQEMGKAITYSRRYGILAGFSIAPEDDDCQKQQPLTEHEKLLIEVVELGQSYLNNHKGNLDMLKTVFAKKPKEQMSVSELTVAKSQIEGLIKGFNLGESA